MDIYYGNSGALDTEIGKRLLPVAEKAAHEVEEVLREFGIEAEVRAQAASD